LFSRDTPNGSLPTAIEERAARFVEARILAVSE
jgi:hypothetical protein